MATWLEGQPLPITEYPMPEGFAAAAHIRSRYQYDEMYKRSLDKPEEFWGEIASELHWNKKWESPFMRFAPNNLLNLSTRGC